MIGCKECHFLGALLLTMSAAFFSNIVGAVSPINTRRLLDFTNVTAIYGPKELKQDKNAFLTAFPNDNDRANIISMQDLMDNPEYNNKNFSAKVRINFNSDPQNSPYVNF